jgi:DNA-binding XRE family transcriptional regulator
MQNLPPFGRLLRFWRQTFALSQESLALTVEVSPRHISFLENGRSKPGLALIYQIARALQLSNRDTSNLLAAAGFSPDDSDHLSSTEQRWLDKSVAMRLRDLDPIPAWVADPYGNIAMVNRGWLHLNQGRLEKHASNLEMNAYHRYFSSSGLRDQLLNWEDLACALLLNLQQEVLLTGDDTAQHLLEELLQYPGIPVDWHRRAALIPYAQSFKIQRRVAQGQTETFIAINTTLGATPYVSQPRMILTALHPTVPDDWVVASEIEHLDHPKLYSQYQ